MITPVFFRTLSMRSFVLPACAWLGILGCYVFRSPYGGKSPGQQSLLYLPFIAETLAGLSFPGSLLHPGQQQDCIYVPGGFSALCLIPVRAIVRHMHRLVR